MSNAKALRVDGLPAWSKLDTSLVPYSIRSKTCGSGSAKTSTLLGVKIMEISVMLPKRLVEAFMNDYEEINGREPTLEEIREFFESDILTVYTSTVSESGFLDAL